MKSKNHVNKSIIQLLFSCFAIALLSGQALAETGHGEEAEHGEEGHIELTQEQIQHSGITLVTATSGTIRDVLPVYGVVATNAERVQSVTARFDGVIREVKKSVGDPVRKGETLVTVEANESLKTYSIVSALNGVITQRNANPGEQTTDTPLLVVQDFSTVWVELSIFPKDVAQVEFINSVAICLALCHIRFHRKEVPFQSIQVVANRFKILRTQRKGQRRAVAAGQHPVHIGIGCRIQCTETLPHLLCHVACKIPINISKEGRIAPHTSHNGLREEETQQKPPPPGVPFLLKKRLPFGRGTRDQQALYCLLVMDER